MRKDHSADILGFINRRLLRATGIQPALGVVGFGRHRGGRFRRTNRDFVPSANG
jgi:hypothetical protein